MGLKWFVRFPWLCSVALVAACGGAPLSPVIPAPDTARMESQAGAVVDRARETLVADPDDSEAWGQFGMVLAAQGFVEEAVICYREAARLAPEDHRWPYLESLALRDSDPDRARAALKKAVSCDPQHPIVWYSAGNAALDAGERTEARSWFERTRELAPRSPFGYFGLARIAVYEGRLDEASILLEQALAVRWRFRQGHLLLAEVLQRKGENDLADRHRMIAANSIDLDPSDPIFDEVVAVGVGAEWSKRRGIALMGEGQISGAEAEFLKAVELAPQDATHLVNLAQVLAAQGRMDEASAALRSALAINPKFLPAHLKLSKVLLRAGDAGAAKQQLEEILRLDPQSDPEAVQAHGGLAAMAADSGDLGEAQEHLEGALKIRPADPTTLIQIAGLAAASGRFSDATDALRLALEVDPTRSDAAMTLAEILLRGGHHGECIVVLRTLVEDNPDHERAGLLLAWELATAPDASDRDGAAAVALAQRIFDRRPGDVTVADILAAALAEAGDFDSAVTVAESAAATATHAGNVEMARAVEGRLLLYRARLPVQK